MGVEAVTFKTKYHQSSHQEENADPVLRRTRQSPYKDIFEAIQNGDLDAVKYFVEKQNVDVNSRAPGNSGTVVGLAAGSGHQNIVEYLVSKGADVNAKDKFGYNSLLWALDKDLADLELIRYLVTNGAEVNAAASSTRYTPLHWAAAHNKLDIVKYLLENNANINAETKDGNTPYTLARANGHTELATHLTNDPKIRFNGDIFAAAESGNIGLVLHMVENERVQPFAKNKSGQTALHIAAANGKLPVVKYFLDLNNSYVNAKNDSGETALIVASANGQLNVVRYLLEIKYANPESVDIEGNTPLLWAAKNGRLDVLRYLIESANADTNVKNNESYNVLLVATQHNRMNVIKYLVDERRLSIYTRNKKGETALHVAARLGFLDTIKYFVDEKGMEVTIAANDGRNVLHKACESDNVNALKYLIEEKGADTTVRDSNQNTLLHIAVENDRLGVVRYLVDQRRMDVYATNSAGQTPVSLAKTLPRNAISQYFTVEKGITARPTTVTPKPTKAVPTTALRTTTTTTSTTPAAPATKLTDPGHSSQTYIFNGQVVDLATRDRLVSDLLPTIGVLTTREETFTNNGRTTANYFINGMQFDLATRNKIINDYKNADKNKFQNMKYYVNGQEVDEKQRNDFLNKLTVVSGAGVGEQQQSMAISRQSPAGGVTYRINGQIVNQDVYMNAVKSRQVPPAASAQAPNRVGMTYFVNGQVVDEATYANAMNFIQPAYTAGNQQIANWGHRRKRSGGDNGRVDRFETVPNDGIRVTDRNSNAAGLLPSAEGQGELSSRKSSSADASASIHGLLTLMEVGARRFTNNRYKQSNKNESLWSPKEHIESRMDENAVKAVRDLEGNFTD